MSAEGEAGGHWMTPFQQGYQATKMFAPEFKELPTPERIHALHDWYAGAEARWKEKQYPKQLPMESLWHDCSS